MTTENNLYIQAIPLFTSEHAMFRYISSHRAELDAMTGDHIVVVDPLILTKSTDGHAWVAPDSKRYDGLKHADLPCLWIKDGGGKHAIIPLPSSEEAISKVFARVTDAAKSASDAPQLKLDYDVMIAQQDSKPVRIWLTGSFFIATTVVLTGCVLALARAISPWWPLVAFVGIAAVLLIIGAFVLRTVGDLSERSMLELIRIAAKLLLNVLDVAAQAVRRIPKGRSGKDTTTSADKPKADKQPSKPKKSK